MKNSLKISLIIPIYKKKEFIEAVLESINYQTYRNFEVIVTEDDNTLGNFIDTLKSKLNYKLIHVQQADLGYRRNTALNNGVKNSSGNLIVVIDQDCMVHPKFLEEYAKSLKKGDMFTGRRFNFGEKYTEFVLKNRIRKFNLLKLLFTDSPIKKFPDAIYFPWVDLKRNTRCLGSNFGIKREVLLKLNGFNEDYIGYGLEDVDIEKRVLMAGGKLFSMKNKAIQYHLYHPEPQGSLDRWNLNKKILDKTIETKQFICKNGLEKL
ncbi:glycosyltransferase [Fusobacterium perfoetens]|uniref:glycosyltransferase n=1 Tax=Fusobacterium perfoetens TaxID=852 RepID=UPI001F390E66|nr:glycosyltransferase [Fusobacterium perfoetens]MCF2612355.1 glycosyltransferase [Fusobacterium perfoetens]